MIAQFVRAHQILLNILIGKAGILTNVPFIGPPVATVLRSVEGVVDVSEPSAELSVIDGIDFDFSPLPFS